MSGPIAVCAHMNLGPFVHYYRLARSMSEAVRSFRIAVEKHYGSLDSSIAEIRGPGEMPCVDLYAPACRDSDDLHCTSRENYHDYPMARYEVGPQGGIRRVFV